MAEHAAIVALQDKSAKRTRRAARAHAHHATFANVDSYLKLFLLLLE